MAALLGVNGSLVLIFVAFLYNVIIGVRLLIRTLKKEKKDADIWNILSAGFIVLGSLLGLFWFLQLYSPSVGVTGFIAFLLLFINNLAATILIFRNKIEGDVLKKISSIAFTLFSLYSFLIITNKIIATTNFELPRFLNWIVVAPSIGYGLSEALLFTGSTAYRFPLFILMPLAIPIEIKEQQTKKKIKEEQKKQNRKQTKKKSDIFTKEVEKKDVKEEKGGFTSFLENGVKGVFVLLLLFLIVFNVIGISVLSSLSTYTSNNYQASFPVREDFEFATALRTGSFQTLLPPNYETLFEKEIELVKELQVSTISIDIITQLLENNQTEFGTIMNRLESEGLKTMLFAYGDSQWTYPISFANYTDTMNTQIETIVSNYEPNYVVIYPQPIVFESYFLDAAENLTINQWTTVFNETASSIHQMSNKTKVVASFTLDDLDSGLFDSVWNNTDIDMVLLNTYIYQKSDLNIEPYLEVSDTNKSFWINSVGFSPVMYGERIQAGVLERLTEIIVNNNNVDGFMYEPLLDRTITASLNGLVAENGHKRLAFYKYQEIIEQVNNL